MDEYEAMNIEEYREMVIQVEYYLGFAEKGAIDAYANLIRYAAEFIRKDYPIPKILKDYIVPALYRIFERTELKTIIVENLDSIKGAKNQKKLAERDNNNLNIRDYQTEIQWLEEILERDKSIIRTMGSVEKILGIVAGKGKNLITINRINSKESSDWMIVAQIISLVEKGNSLADATNTVSEQWNRGWDITMKLYYDNHKRIREQIDQAKEIQHQRELNRKLIENNAKEQN
ncbi:hypothetical protein K8I28_11360 [bacterium]|nr:hypothetical protein [bacterium]